MPLKHLAEAIAAVHEAKRDGFEIIVLEQTERSLKLNHFTPSGPTALVLGNEVTGVLPELINAADAIVEIPMVGKKESLNVAVAAGIAIYHLKLST